MMHKLTQKQERFCIHYVEKGNASEAYRQAYETARMKPETINKRASELLASGEVAGRLAEIRKAAADKAAMTLESHLADLKSLRNAAVKDGKWSAAVTAEVARGKAAGLYVEKIALNTGVTVFLSQQDRRL